MDLFIDRYFEPIGLNKTSEEVKRARKEERIERHTWESAWFPIERRRNYRTNHSLPSLNLTDIDGHELKRVRLLENDAFDMALF